MNHLIGIFALAVTMAQASTENIEVRSDFNIMRRQSDVSSTTYGVNGGGIMHVRGAMGSEQAPLRVPAGMIYGGFGGRPCLGWHANSLCEFPGSSPVSIHWLAAEDQTPAAMGGSLRVWTTPNGSNIRYPRLEITNNGTIWARDEHGGFNPANASQTRPNPTVRLLASGGNGTGVSVGAAVYGTGDAGFRSFTAGGAPEAPSAVIAGRYIGFVAAHGHDGNSFGAGSAALVGMQATEDWNVSARGTRVTIETTEKRTNTRKPRVTIDENGVWFHKKNGQVVNLVQAEAMK